MKVRLFRDRELRCTVLPLVATTWIICGATTLSAGGRPVRIAIDPERTSVGVGTSAEVKIELRDASDRDADTSKDLHIELAVALEGGGVKRQKVIIKAGTDSIKVKVPFYAPGIYLLKATHPHLRDGAAHIRVKAGSIVPAKRWHLNRLVHYDPQPGGIMPAHFHRLPLTPFAKAAFQPSASPIEVQFHYADEGSKLIANGVERCKIMAFLSEPAPFDIQLRMTSTLGSLAPNPIVIEKGQDEASADLVSTKSGDINVKFVASRPPRSIRVVRGDEKEIHFAPPITSLRLTPSPPRIPLGRTTNIEVELTDEKGLPTATEDERNVTLIIEDGFGDFASSNVTIKPGEHRASIPFRPSVSGRIMLSARTIGAQTKEPSVLEVGMPVLAMIFTTLAGLVGGLFAAARSQELTRWKIAYSSLAGIAAAFLLYSACQTGLVPKLPPPATVNFFGATMIGLVGGWLGTEAFNMIVKMAGLPMRAT